VNESIQRYLSGISSVVSPSKSFDVKMSKALVSSVAGSSKGESGSSRSDGRSRRLVFFVDEPAPTLT
jgi:hypothetical protein